MPVENYICKKKATLWNLWSKTLGKKGIFGIPVFSDSCTVNNATKTYENLPVFVYTHLLSKYTMKDIIVAYLLKKGWETNLVAYAASCEF